MSDYKYVFRCSGRAAYADRLILGLSLLSPGVAERRNWYDVTTDEWREDDESALCLTNDERKELSELMCARWTEWAKGLP